MSVSVLNMTLALLSKTAPSEKAAARVVATEVYPMPTLNPAQSSLLTRGRGGGRRGAELYDRKKAWAFIYHLIIHTSVTQYFFHLCHLQQRSPVHHRQH